jgi:hypothetical protein
VQVRFVPRVCPGRAYHVGGHLPRWGAAIRPTRCLHATWRSAMRQAALQAGCHVDSLCAVAQGGGTLPSTWRWEVHHQRSIHVLLAVSMSNNLCECEIVSEWRPAGHCCNHAELRVSSKPAACVAASAKPSTRLRVQRWRACHAARQIRGSSATA